MKNSEVRKQEGLRKPVSLVEACEILGDSKNLQDNAEAKLKVCPGSQKKGDWLSVRFSRCWKTRLPRHRR